MTRKDIVRMILFLGASLACAFLIMFLWSMALMSHRLPPENYTATAMYPLRRRILRFARAQGRLPSAISETPPLEDFINETTDVWGNEIKYLVDGTTITLLSYGKDQKPGGTGDDRDVIGVFEARRPDGNWTEENPDWEWKQRPLDDKK
jgi:hypothetical protein